MKEDQALIFCPGAEISPPGDCVCGSWITSRYHAAALSTRNGEIKQNGKSLHRKGLAALWGPLAGLVNRDVDRAKLLAVMEPITTGT